VRFVFLDEGGISQYEPWVVVAGIIVNGDQQVVPLEERLAFLVEKHIPAELRDGFIFHAKDLWSGSGPIFKDRDRWPLPMRLNILHDLVRIPAQHQVPIVFYALERSRVQFDGIDYSKVSAHEMSVAVHGMTFTGCTLRIEQHMLEVWPNEIAQLVAEDNDQARVIIKRSHEVIRHPKWMEQNNIELHGLLPLTKIRNAVHFASKAESSLLQLADVCAFFIRGILSGRKNAHPFYKKLRKWMLMLPKPELLPSNEGSPVSGSFVLPWHV
jgi:hypothetical protein